jgi:mRNA interferase MazF
MVVAHPASTALAGELWWVHIKDAVGNEQDGERPFLVLVNYPMARLIMGVPFTKNLDARRFSYTHQVSRTVENGLRIDSIAQVYQSRTLAYSRFLEKLGILERDHMIAIRFLIRDYFKDYLK